MHRLPINPTERIAQIDEQAVTLLGQRLEVALVADAEKDNRGLRVFAPQREEDVLDHVRQVNQDAGEVLDPCAVITHYVDLMRATRVEQLQARLARGTITAAEQRNLERLTKRPAEALRAKAQLLPAAPGWLEDGEDVLTTSRRRIDDIDEQLMRSWVERQRLVIVRGRPRIGDMHGTMGRIIDLNSELSPRLSTPELILVLRGLFVSMQEKQKGIAAEAHEAAMASLASLAAEAAADKNNS